MSAFLTKLARISDNATITEALSFWTSFAFILGVVFAAEVATIAVMVARAG